MSKLYACKDASHLLSIGENSLKWGKFLSILVVSPVGYLKRNISAGHTDLVYESERPIKWLFGKPPLDHPKCGFKGELCQKHIKPKKSNGKLTESDYNF